ncbi:hypothetical protein HHK36_011782 [Tetracentron sinense]|uniref:Uncharacterized protein n=1 Tax=Tetracentron sinense TaxID=13715 RepID=A0A835DHJ1_TETSI|nr:hypothetical protein HHK36_011782 [Tetracentron sinense]
MTWKERKALENRRVVSLGGKPQKNQRIPLSVARVTMKKQKEREQKKSQENLVLGRFGRKLGSNTNRVAGKRKAEDRVLKSIEGHFRNGVLNVKHLVKPTSSRDIDSVTHGIGLGEKKKKKESGKKSRGKKKGGKKRH